MLVEDSERGKVRKSVEINKKKLQVEKGKYMEEREEGKTYEREMRREAT